MITDELGVKKAEAADIESDKTAVESYMLWDPVEKWHNIEHPEHCRCYPEVTLYADEDGVFDLVIINHMRLQ